MNLRTALLAFLPLAVFLAVAVLLASGIGRDPEAMPSALIDQPVPSFELPVLGGDGKVTEEIFEGEWKLVNIWGSWCPTCYVEHPYLIELARDGVPIVGINYRDTLDGAREYLAGQGNPYSTVIVDESGDLGMDFGVYGAPETYIVDPHGRVRLRHAGELNARVWEEKFLPIWEREELEE